MNNRAAARVRRASWALAASLASPAALLAQYSEAPAHAAYAIRGATVMRPDGSRLAGVNVIVRGSFIEAIGANAAIPADAHLLTGDSLIVYPGFVDAHGTAKLELPREQIDRARVAPWDPPRSLQGFMPSRRAADHLASVGKDMEDARKKGIVASAVYPPDAVMAGQGALLVHRKNANSPSELVIQPSIGQLMSFRTERGIYPSTLFGAIAFLRQTFEDAGHRRLLASAHTADPRLVTSPAWDADYAAVQDALAGRSRVFFSVSGAEDIRRVLALADEYRFQPIIVGGGEAWRVAEQLRARNIPVLVSLDFPKPKRWKPTEKRDSAAAKPAKEADAAELREKREMEELYANAGKLAKAGVRFALTTGGGKADPREGARKAIEYGLGEADALRALTTTPAALLGAPELARMEAGMPANLVVSNRPLFGKDSRIVYTFVEGQLQRGQAPGEKKDAAKDSTSAPAAAIAGSWSTSVTLQGQGDSNGTMVLKQEGSTFTGTVQTEIGEFRIRDGRINGNEITFIMMFEMGGQSMEFTFTGTVTGDQASGTGSSPMGSFTWTARRTAGPGEEERR